MSYTFKFDTSGGFTAYAAPQAVPTTLATAVVAPPAGSTYYPFLDTRLSTIDARDIATPTIADEAAKPSSTDASTIIVDKDETWEAEYLKAMEEAEEMKKESMPGKKKRCGGGGKMAKRCNNFCGGGMGM